MRFFYFTAFAIYIYNLRSLWISYEYALAKHEENYAIPAPTRSEILRTAPKRGFFYLEEFQRIDEGKTLAQGNTKLDSSEFLFIVSSTFSDGSARHLKDRFQRISKSWLLWAKNYYYSCYYCDYRENDFAITSFAAPTKQAGQSAVAQHLKSKRDRHVDEGYIKLLKFLAFEYDDQLLETEAASTKWTVLARDESFLSVPSLINFVSDMPRDLHHLPIAIGYVWNHSQMSHPPTLDESVIILSRTAFYNLLKTIVISGCDNIEQFNEMGEIELSACILKSNIVFLHTSKIHYSNIENGKDRNRVWNNDVIGKVSSSALNSNMKVMIKATCIANYAYKDSGLVEILHPTCSDFESICYIDEPPSKRRTEWDIWGKFNLTSDL